MAAAREGPAGGHQSAPSFLSEADASFLANLRRPQAIAFRAKCKTVRLKKTRQTKDWSLGSDSIGTEEALDHDAIKWNRIMISSLCLSMIFSENRFPLFRIML
jgi:hypothetical protein